MTNVDWPAKRLDVALTKKQVKDSPSIDTQRPVSRQYETEYLGYYGYPNYWNGSYLWGQGASPAMTTRIDSPREVLAERIRRASMDSHLRSTAAVTGYHIEAMDGEIGHVAGFFMDDETWAIRYIEVRNAQLVAGQEGTVFTRVDSKGQLGEFQSVCRPLPRCDPDGAALRRFRAAHS